ncbi:MAG: zinc-ribbon domain-containing protein [Deltaproteobacteria bacterium]|nr:zinc-ribbon domain-containing protein [Deltaproteobacteria bacterium]
MIVICDKCNTKYKLDDSAITEDGAKVRCSKCGNTFIVKRPRAEDIQKITQSAVHDTQVPQADIHSDLDKAINETLSDLTGQRPGAQEAAGTSPNEFDWSGLSDEKKEPVQEGSGDLEWRQDNSDVQEEEAVSEPIEVAETAPKEGSALPPDPQPVAATLDKEPKIYSPTVEHVINESIKQDRFENISDTVTPIIKKVVISFIAIIVIAAAGYSAYTYRSELLALSREIYTNVSTYVAATKPANIGISVSDSKGYFLKNVRGQQLFVIEGDVANTTAHSVSFIKLTANISDSDNNVIASKSFYAANILTDNELRTLTSDQINSKIANEMGQSLKNFNIPPSGKVPFMVVFFDVPDNLTSFTVTPTGVHTDVQ